MEGTQENPTPIFAADCTLPETAASLGTVGGQTDGAGPGHTVRIVSPHMCHADNWSTRSGGAGVRGPGWVAGIKECFLSVGKGLLKDRVEV